MARRSVSTLLITAIVAVMVGIRDATGIGPPPPTLSTEEIEWLSPERENDPGLLVVLEEPAPVEARVESDPEVGTRPALFEWARTFFRTIGGRRE